jgi:inosine-uridine nucleoside N-ribohydrolase
LHIFLLHISGIDEVKRAQYHDTHPVVFAGGFRFSALKGYAVKISLNEFSVGMTVLAKGNSDISHKTYRSATAGVRIERVFALAVQCLG